MTGRPRYDRAGARWMRFGLTLGTLLALAPSATAQGENETTPTDEPEPPSRTDSLLNLGFDQLTGILGTGIRGNGWAPRLSYVVSGATTFMIVLSAMAVARYAILARLAQSWVRVYTPLVHVLVGLGFLAMWTMFAIAGGLATGTLVIVLAYRHKHGTFLGWVLPPPA